MIKMSKNIVVCFDGTNNEYGTHNTNVVKTFEAIIRDDNQIAFYDPGVGTLSFFGRVLGRKIGILLGLAFGYGIRQNVEDGYEYLMNRYQKEDKIYIRIQPWRLYRQGPGWNASSVRSFTKRQQEPDTVRLKNVF